tara:strand:+ start:289 stop:570 length:282 start_codon:yes stop_codon:yes gene_type:complete
MKKKKEEVVVKEEPTETMETETTKEVEEKKEEITEEQKKVQKMVEEFNKNYNGIFTSQDFVNIQSNVHICNLLMGILEETKKTNQYFKEMLEK